MDKRLRFLAGGWGLVLTIAACILALRFTLFDHWIQKRVWEVIGLYIVSIPLFEFGGSGRWVPRIPRAASFSGGLFRVLVGMVGLGLVVLSCGFCLALGERTVKWSSVGFILGACATGMALVRGALTAKLFSWSYSE
jgi:hypothetical protein